MKKLYEKLYTDCLVDDRFLNSAHFVSMEGELFAKSAKKFMLIGRAPNGWGSLNTLNREVFGNDAANQFNNLNRWDWIESINGILYNRVLDETQSSTSYCIDQKPFWSYSKEICKHILDSSDRKEGIWQKNIVWSNLYKVSPSKSDNPDEKMQKIQLTACIEILKKELEIYKPTHIFIATGFDWFKPFSNIFNTVCDLNRRNISRGKNKNNIYVEGTAAYDNAKVVIACRPEYRDRDDYIAEVLKYFS